MHRHIFNGVVACSIANSFSGTPASKCAHTIARDTRGKSSARRKISSTASRFADPPRKNAPIPPAQVPPPRPQPRRLCDPSPLSPASSLSSISPPSSRPSSSKCSFFHVIPTPFSDT